MKNTSIIFIFFLSCTYIENYTEDQHSHPREYQKAGIQYILRYNFKDIKVEIFHQSDTSIKFNSTIGLNNVSGIASLVRLEDENGKYVPEGTDRFDERTMEQYPCDSTYSFDSDSISLTFCMENISNERLSFIVSKSKITGVNNKFYTLYLAN